jgi:hypothetical protein
MLRPSETAYVARTRDRRKLRFSKSGNPAIELAYRTHWVSPELSEAKRERLVERQSRPPELVVVVPLHEYETTLRSASAAAAALATRSGISARFMSGSSGAGDDLCCRRRRSKGAVRRHQRRFEPQGQLDVEGIDQTQIVAAGPRAFHQRCQVVAQNRRRGKLAEPVGYCGRRELSGSV